MQLLRRKGTLIEIMDRFQGSNLLKETIIMIEIIEILNRETIDLSITIIKIEIKITEVKEIIIDRIKDSSMIDLNSIIILIKRNLRFLFLI